MLKALVLMAALAAPAAPAAPAVTGASAADPAESLAYLESHAQAPADYILSKFDTHQLVLLGEDHAVKEHLDLVAGLIPRLYERGVRTLCVEFGAVEMQERLDGLLNAPDYSEAEARDMLFYYNVGWAYREYADLYRAAWELNRSLPADAPRFRIVNLSYRYDWPAFVAPRTPESMARVFFRGTPDAFRAEVIEREVIAKDLKALVFMGSAHVFTRYQMPVLDMNADDFVSLDDGFLGNRLYRKYPDRLFNIALHFPFPPASGTNPPLLSPADGAIEAIMGARGNRPAGFDLVGTPLGELPDHSLFAAGHLDFRMKDFFDGYVFVKPFRALTGCTVDSDFFTGRDWASEIEPHMPDPYWHKAASLEDYWTQIRGYVNLKQRYATFVAEPK